MREMTEADIDAVAAVRIAGWRTAYAGLMPRAYLDAMSAAEDAERHRARFARRPERASDLVAEREGRVTGWAALGPARDADLAARAGELAPGELFALYAAPELIGTGIGRLLLAAALERAGTSGFGTLSLWVVRGNVRARRFYERAGFLADGAEETYDVGGRPVPEVRYRRPVAP